ncbi:MAG: cation:proton antiporter [archaeon]
MDLVILTLLAISLILFFGFFAEFGFRKFNVPDVLLLIILGFIIGPSVLGYINPIDLVTIAPVFTTFTLLFLLFDGAFNINLSSLIKEFSHSFVLTVYNFFISSIVITCLMLLFQYFLFDQVSVLGALLTGFALGGVSSAFVIPVLKQMDIKPKLYSLLALESALTDVFCIVFSLTVLEVFILGGFGIQSTFSQIAALFAVAVLVGLIAGIIWIFLVLKVFKEHNYMMAIAYLILVYVLAEFLHGNGAIAALFFGLVLYNSKQLSSIIRGITFHGSEKEKEGAISGDLGVSITTPSEKFFYDQLSFFLKTFFFVYIGILIDISNIKLLIIGIIISVVLMGSRVASRLLTKGYDYEDRTLVNSIFARGLAAAAIAQIAIQAGFPGAEDIGKVIYVVITGTILLSSVRVFILKMHWHKIIGKGKELHTKVKSKEKSKPKVKRYKSKRKAKTKK